MRNYRCGHERTLENSVAYKLGKGCRQCAAKRQRERYYRGRGYDSTPLPLAYRNALRGFAGRWPQVGSNDTGNRTYIPSHFREILVAADALARASYIMVELHDRSIAEVSHWLKISEADVGKFRDDIKHALSVAKHKSRYRDWPLVQDLIDAGVGEPELKQMLSISKAQWNYVKRVGVIHV